MPKIHWIQIWKCDYLLLLGLYDSKLYFAQFMEQMINSEM